MSQTESPAVDAVRREVAHVLRLMRAMRKTSPSLNDLLDELAKLRNKSPEALKYVHISVTRSDNPDHPPRLVFHANKQRLQKTPAIPFTGVAAGSAVSSPGTGAMPS